MLIFIIALLKLCILGAVFFSTKQYREVAHNIDKEQNYTNHDECVCVLPLRKWSDE